MHFHDILHRVSDWFGIKANALSHWFPTFIAKLNYSHPLFTGHILTCVWALIVSLICTDSSACYKRQVNHKRHNFVQQKYCFFFFLSCGGSWHPAWEALLWTKSLNSTCVQDLETQIVYKNCTFKGRPTNYSLLHKSRNRNSCAQIIKQDYNSTATLAALWGCIADSKEKQTLKCQPAGGTRARYRGSPTSLWSTEISSIQHLLR